MVAGFALALGVRLIRGRDYRSIGDVAGRKPPRRLYWEGAHRRVRRGPPTSEAVPTREVGCSPEIYAKGLPWVLSGSGWRGSAVWRTGSARPATGTGGGRN